MAKVQKAKRIRRTQRHIRWNWEASPDSPELVRYHFIIVDDKGRETTLNLLLNQLVEYGGGAEIVRRTEGKVVETEFRYLFGSYDSRTKPTMLNFSKIGKPTRRDKELSERKIGNIENYVADLYERSR